MVDSVFRPALLDPASYLVPPKSSTSHVRPPPLGYLQEKGYSALIEIAFIENALRRMTLMCDCLVALSPEHMRFCISALGQFGRQVVTNIRLRLAKTVFWGISDGIQDKAVLCRPRAGVQRALWMCILLAILRLRADARPEVRIGAI